MQRPEATRLGRRRNILWNLPALRTPLMYVVRIRMGNLRPGLGDATVLDALVTVRWKDAKKRKLLEGAYNKTSDLGLIASGKYSRSFRKRPAGGYLLFGFLLCPAFVHLSRPTLTDPCAAGSSGC